MDPPTGSDGPPSRPDGRAPDPGAPDRRRRVGRRGRLLVAATVVVAVVLVLRYRVDWRAVVSAVATADPGPLALGAVAALCGLACWSEAMRHLLPPDADPVSRRRGFLVYATGSLVRNAIPLGYASSIAVLGYVYRREAGVSLDRSLAAVSVAEFVSAAASTGFALAGVLLLATARPRTSVTTWLAVVAIGLVALVGGALALGWYRRDAVERAVHAAASLLSGVARRLADGRAGVVSPDAVELAIAGYYRSLSSVSARRRTVGVALGYAVLGWAAFVASLYACGLAAGYRVPLPVAMIVVSVGGYATVLPLPGGLGGYELGVAGAIAILGGTDAVTALAVTLLFRLCSYWLVIATGVVASAAISVDLRRLVGTVLARDGPEPDSADR